jgi:hypothetical protein
VERMKLDGAAQDLARIRESSCLRLASVNRLGRLGAAPTGMNDEHGEQNAFNKHRDRRGPRALSA